MNEFNEVQFVKKITKTGGSLGVNFTKEVRTLGLKEGDLIRGCLSKYEMSSKNFNSIQSQQVDADGNLRPSLSTISGLKSEEIAMAYVLNGTIYFHGIFEEEIPMEEGLEVLGQDRVIHIVMRDGAPVLTIEPLKTGIIIEYSMFDIKHGSRTITQGLLIKSSPYETWEPVSKIKEE